MLVVVATLPPTNPSPSLSRSDSWNYPVGGAGGHPGRHTDHLSHHHNAGGHQDDGFQGDHHSLKCHQNCFEFKMCCSVKSVLLLSMRRSFVLNSECIGHQYQIPMGPKSSLWAVNVCQSASQTHVSHGEVNCSMYIKFPIFFRRLFFTSAHDGHV